MSYAKFLFLAGLIMLAPHVSPWLAGALGCYALFLSLIATLLRNWRC
ncbi:hypothetical protein [Robbsia andropogonis]|nr:hypothetical protein [Robbsia andropogonis]MCP1121544.1 hypothetical protein [Robbsia andropogonis]MCP1131369.1 hypothetical protein [Robbsia andropogonis]